MYSVAVVATQAEYGDVCQALSEATGVIMARVLVIEDDSQQRDVYATLLYYNGFEVEQADTAEAGIATALEHHPDIILLDIQLPGMNGLQAANVFKNTPATADIPVICMSAYDIPSRHVARAGADSFLKKPIGGDVLVRAIRKLIGSAAKPRSNTSSLHALVIAPKESEAARSMIELFQVEGLRVSRAADGATGLGMVSVVHPDFVVAHLESPVLDGWAVLKRLKSDPSIKSTPLVAMSETPTKAEETQCMQGGFAGYLKAADADGVLEVIYRSLLRPTA